MLGGCAEIGRIQLLVAFRNRTTVGADMVDTCSDWMPLTILLFSIVFGSLFLPFLLFGKAHATAAAGELQLKVVRPRIRLWHRIGLVIGVCLGAAVIILHFAGPEGRSHWLQSSLPLMIVAILEIANRVFGLDPWVEEIRENGIVLHSIAFLPWDRIIDCRWKDGRVPTMVFQISRCGFIHVGVLPEQREDVQTLLQGHVPAVIGRELSQESR